MLTHLSEAFILGLSMGPVCLGYCAPVCVPFLACEQRNWRSGTRVLGLFLLGRLAGYSVVGAIAGAAGALLVHNVSPVFWGGLRIAMGGLLVLYGMLAGTPVLRPLAKPSVNVTSQWFGASLGLLTGINLCPPFGAAIAGAAAAASVRSALLYFWAFFAGTAIYFVPLVALGPLSRIDALRQTARVCLFLAGAWLVVEGLLISFGRG